MNRRTLLRGAGVALALPALESLAPLTAQAAPTTFKNDGVPRRLLCICNSLGLHLPHFVPEQTGRGYTASPYLKIIDDLRDQYTVLSGVSHPEVDGGHAAEKSFLTTAPRPSGPSFKNSVSLDQFAVDFIGRETRFPSLTLAANGQEALSWTRAGVPIPGASLPSRVFAKLFFHGNKQEVEQQVLKLRMGQSIMDTVHTQARRLEKNLGREDRDKFDEYLTSVREVEQQMQRQQEWEHKPKPKVLAKPPRDVRAQADVIGRLKLMYDLSALALQTDSTRVITIASAGFFLVPPIDGVSEGYHTLSHHGKNIDKIRQLAIIESEHLRILGDLLRKLDRTKEGGDTLLDRTTVLYGSNLGNASSHDNRNLPTILAGGDFKHGQHLGFDANNNARLGDAFVSILQGLGIESDRFGSGTKTLAGLELR